VRGRLGEAQAVCLRAKAVAEDHWWPRDGAGGDSGAGAAGALAETAATGPATEAATRPGTQAASQPATF